MKKTALTNTSNSKHRRASKIAISNESKADAVAANANNLLLDAQILFKEKRYATATALAILSLEESGKNALMEGLFKLSISGDFDLLRSHTKKQKAVSRLVIESMAHFDITELLRTQGIEMRLVRAVSGKEMESVSLENLFSTMNVKKIPAEITAKLSEKAQYKFIIMLAKGQFEDVKRSSLYVDIGSSGAVLSSPVEITRDTAHRAIRLASRAISITSQERKRRLRRSAFERNSGKL